MPQDNIHLWKLDESDGLTIWIVDGFYVRSNIDADFTEGGNDAAYPDFVPDGEIWLDDETSVHEWKYIILHEKTERQLMKDEGLDYNAAHDKANEIELAARHEDYPNTDPAQAEAGTHENEGGKSMDEIKVGARNNSEDQKRMQQIHDLAVMNGAMCDNGSDGEKRTKLIQAKSITDAPNLRGRNDQACVSCKYYKMLPAKNGAMATIPAEVESSPFSPGICEKFDFQTQDNWTCDAWESSIDTGMEKSIDLVYFGDTVKSLSATGEVGGYLVRWGSPQEKDLEGDYFTKNTYFGAKDGDGADTFMNHCIPLAKGLEEFADWVGKPIKTNRDSIGLFAKTVLDLADEYEKIIFDLVQKGKLKWSSGTASHLVKRMKDGQIKRWIISDASFTPIPAEWRESNKVYPIKSYREMFDTWSAEGLVKLAEATALEAAREIPEDLKREAAMLKARAGASSSQDVLNVPPKRIT